MKISQEAENAVRIVCCLAAKYRYHSDSPVKAKDLATDLEISTKFTLKIMRKLIMAGIAGSCKGVYGGYYLTRSPSEISFGEIVESIDGSLNVFKAIYDKHVSDEIYSIRARRLNNLIRAELWSEKISYFMDEHDSTVRGQEDPVTRPEADPGQRMDLPAVLYL